MGNAGNILLPITYPKMNHNPPRYHCLILPNLLYWGKSIVITDVKHRTKQKTCSERHRATQIIQNIVTNDITNGIG